MNNSVTAGAALDWDPDSTGTPRSSSSSVGTKQPEDQATTSLVYGGAAVKEERRAEDDAVQEAVETLRQVRNEAEERGGEVTESEEDVFGKYIATQLRSLRPQPRLALITRHKIEQVLFDARMELMPAEPQGITFASASAARPSWYRSNWSD